MTKSVMLTNISELPGKATYKVLDLDSDILGFKTAKVISIQTKDSLKKILIQKLIKSFRNEKIRYATFRLNANDFVTINILEEEGFRLVDEYLILKKEIGKREQNQTQSIEIREANAADSEKLQNELGSVFIYSRFFNDPLIKKDAARKMHELWINNCILGKTSEKVFVGEVGGKCVGFIAVEMDGKEGHIPLIGVSPKHRGKGISQQLTVYVINNWFIKRDAKLLRIETQLTNIPAARAYENMDFRLTDSAVTLRWAQ